MIRSYTTRRARLRDRTRELAAILRPAAAEIDRQNLFPADLLAALWEAGFMSLTVPRAFGGAGAAVLDAAIVVEELSRGSGAAGLMVVLQALGVNTLRAALTDKALAGWYEKIVTERVHLAFALSEPDPAPGEKASLTTARKLKSEYVLSGRKTFVSGGREADFLLVFAATAPRAPLVRALSVFILPAGTTGLLPGPELPRSGLRGVPATELRLEGCRVPASALLGRPGKGYAVAERALLETAPLVAALAAGLLREALECTLTRIQAHRHEPRPTSEFQPLELALAEAAARLDTTIALTELAARAVDEKWPEAERLTREAKWIATESAVEEIDQLANLFGLEAGIKGSVMERLSRDARSACLLLGANHLHRIAVARKLLARASLD